MSVAFPSFTCDHLRYKLCYLPVLTILFGIVFFIKAFPFCYWFLLNSLIALLILTHLSITMENNYFVEEAFSIILRSESEDSDSLPDNVY